MRFKLKQLFLILVATPLVAQVQEEVNPPANIKTVIFKGQTEDQFPIVTISLGAAADKDLMQGAADITGGVHFNIPGGQSVATYEEDLKDVFREIADHRPLKLVK